MVKQEIIKHLHCDKCGNEITDANKANWHNRITLSNTAGMEKKITVQLTDYGYDNTPTIHHPDLCKDCVRKILNNLINNL